ncbi:MAG: HflK protein [Gammaproteobacteria bacterium RIFCSPLOWO2_02_FULL_56_15]|nr:MAG: HflK protein [Gammaproteobacteria bacterium RIFCSPLOWO2_02_FULL_56_15]
MGWNEPPGGNRDRDPWGGRDKKEGPPDLDEIVRKMQQGLGGLFGKKPPSSPGGGSSITAAAWLIIILVLLIFCAFDMVYFVDPQERGVVQRFGSYQTTWLEGLNIRFPRPIETVQLVNVEKIRTLSHKDNMLTQDENIVDVEVAVQWKIKDPVQYLFSVRQPDETLKQVIESAVREVIGKSKLDFVLTEGRGQIAQSQLKLIQQTLDDYEIGILVSAVEMQPAKPPEQVKDAFDDAIKAREDEQRLVNESEAYVNDIIPRARGAAARIREESNGYKARVIARAEGDAARFDQLLAEYTKAPEITRKRLYLDAMESILSNTSKVFLDAEGNNSLIYLPIDRLLDNRSSKQMPGLETQDSRVEPTNPSAQEERDLLDSRARGVR